MKVLFICELIKNKSGGLSSSLRNERMLQSFYGSESVVTYKISRNNSNKFLFLLNDLRHKSFYGLSEIHKRHIKQMIYRNEIQLCFLDSSCLGQLAETIKKEFPHVKVVTFFQNIEYLFQKDVIRLSRRFYFSYRLYNAYYNEKKACKYSDEVIVLNNRDSKELFRIYKRKASIVIPISLKDVYIPQTVRSTIQSYCLFVGSNFPPNMEGITHFIKKILPCMNTKLVVIGSGMDILKKTFPNTEHLDVKGFVKDVSTYYYNALFVIMPIYSGSGMKVKTAEALMYGKYILATKEALEGYEINQNIGMQCNTDAEFIDAVKKLERTPPNRFNEESREIYLNMYSDIVAQKNYNLLFKSLNI